MRKISSLADVQIVLNDLLNWKDRESSKARDQRGLQVKNAGDAKDPQDLVTLRQLEEKLAAVGVSVSKPKRSGLGGGGTVIPPPTPTAAVVVSVVGNEVGPVTIDLTNQLPHTKIRVSGTTNVAVPANSQVTIFLSSDDGTNYTAINSFAATSTWFSTLDFGDIDILVPSGQSNYRAAAVLNYSGFQGGQILSSLNLPTGTVVSERFIVQGIGSPSPTGVTGLQWSTPVYAGYNSVGAPYWKSNLVGNLPGLSDPNSWFFSVTVECVDANGNSDPGPDLNTIPFSGTCIVQNQFVIYQSGERFNPSLTDANLGIRIDGYDYVVTAYISSEVLIIASPPTSSFIPKSFTCKGGERIFGEFTNSGGTFQALAGFSTTLLGNYNPNGSSYTYIRSKCYATNRNVTLAPGWKDLSSIRQTQAFNGTSQQIFQFGSTPQGTSGNFPVINPGFEEGLHGWSKVTATNTSAAVGVNTTSPHSGSFCMQLGQNTSSGVSQVFNVTTGQIIQVSVWMKTASSPSDNASIVFLFLDANSAAIGSQLVNNFADPGTTWTQKLAYATVPSGAKTVRVRFQRNTYAGGDWFIDDVAITWTQGNNQTIGGISTGGSNNPSTSILNDWDFSMSQLGTIAQIGGNQSWAIYGTAEVKNDNAGVGNYVRLTNASAQILQSRTITAGQAFYFSIQVRSSNTAATHSVTYYVSWFDATGTIIGSKTAIGTASGYISAWTQGPATWITAPTNASVALVSIEVSPSETAGGYWDIGKVIVQRTTNQTDGTQTNSQVPVAGGGGSSTALKSQYGTSYMSLSWDSIYFIRSTLQQANLMTTSGGGSQLDLVANAGVATGFITLAIDNTGQPYVTIQVSGGAPQAGYTGAVAGRNAVCGIVV